MDVKRGAAAVVFAFLFAIAWPNPGAIGKETRSSPGHQIDLNCNPAVSDACAKARLKERPEALRRGEIRRYGRTCRTCHSNRTGTFSPEEALARLIEDQAMRSSCMTDWTTACQGRRGSRNTRQCGSRSRCLRTSSGGRSDPLGDLGTRPRRTEHAALDPMLMCDTREPNLELQAFNAIHGHAQNTREPGAGAGSHQGVPANGFAASSPERRCGPLPTAVLRRNCRQHPGSNGAGARCSTTCLSMA